MERGVCEEEIQLEMPWSRDKARGKEEDHEGKVEMGWRRQRWEGGEHEPLVLC
jgi:hypothetical protein